MAGVDLNRIKELMGHRDINTTLTYAKLKMEDLRNEVNKLKFPTGVEHD